MFEWCFAYKWAPPSFFSWDTHASDDCLLTCQTLIHHDHHLDIAELHWDWLPCRNQLLSINVFIDQVCVSCSLSHEVKHTRIVYFPDEKILWIESFYTCLGLHGGAQISLRGRVLAGSCVRIGHSMARTDHPMIIGETLFSIVITLLLFTALASVTISALQDFELIWTDKFLVDAWCTFTYIRHRSTQMLKVLCPHFISLQRLEHHLQVLLNRIHLQFCARLECYSAVTSSQQIELQTAAVLASWILRIQAFAAFRVLFHWCCPVSVLAVW